MRETGAFLSFTHNEPEGSREAVKAEGLYSSKTTVYHIEHRVMRLRADDRRAGQSGSPS
jgi:hypothetical protein